MVGGGGELAPFPLMWTSESWNLATELNPLQSRLSGVVWKCGGEGRQGPCTK